MSAHTPTPWVHDGTGRIAPAISDGECICEVAPRNYIGHGGLETGKANRDFIVLACNTHAELVAALEACKEHAYIPHGKPWLLEQINAAISRAKG